jgi:hypothetical protein
MAEGGAIIIKCGSVELIFDNTLYTQRTTDPSSYKNDYRKIINVQVQDGEGKLRYDSGANEDGLDWTITVSTK